MSLRDYLVAGVVLMATTFGGINEAGAREVRKSDKSQSIGSLGPLTPVYLSEFYRDEGYFYGHSRLNSSRKSS